MIVSSQYLKHISSLLKVKIEKINFNEDSLCTCVVNGKKISGVINIITSLLGNSNSNLAGSSPLDKSEIQQWIEYALVYAVHVDNNYHNLNFILNELNAVFSTKTYLVAYKLTIADILLFYTLSNVMASLASSEKEKYINVSRWFDNLQQDNFLRQSNTLVNFSTNYLASIVPARH